MSSSEGKPLLGGGANASVNGSGVLLEHSAPPKTMSERMSAFVALARTKMTKDNLVKVGLLVFVIVIGAVNRVTFKVMQYGSYNYSYFISQFTTFVYLPVNFTVIFFKLCFTNQIDAEQRAFPKWKFFVMGLMDSLQGLLIVVGGVQVPGMMQNLLLQGAVPVTMVFSIIMLRQRESESCQQVRAMLKKNKIKFDDRTIFPEKFSDAEPPFVEANGRKVDFQQLSRFAESGELGARLVGTATGTGAVPAVVMQTDRPTWKVHCKTFYRPAQYIGASIIMVGLVVSVWDSLTGRSGGGTGPFGWDVVFFTATVPTALSAVFKQLAFDSVDLDVWYLNGWVSVFQFLIGLLYAPLAAVMNDPPLAVSDIPVNMWNGMKCLAGINTIVPNVTIVNNVTVYGICNPFPLTHNGTGLQWCDSCNGLYPEVSSVPAYAGIIMYMIANIIYNVVMILVIKKFDAAMMYVASTVVLPLGAVCFTVPAFMGLHVQTFTVFVGVGLGLVLLGLIIYRFIGGRKGSTSVAGSTGGLLAEPITVPAPPTVPLKPRTTEQLRVGYYGKLGVQSGARTPDPTMGGRSSSAARDVEASAFQRTAPQTIASSAEMRTRSPPATASRSGYQNMDDTNSDM